MIDRIIKMALVPLAVCLSASCLKEDRSSIVDPNDYFRTEQQCESAVNSCYMPLKNIYVFQYMIATEAVTDLASANGSAQVDARLMISPGSSGIGSTIWKQCYIGVRNSCCAIERMESSTLKKDQIAHLLGEARILRAYYYYLLTSFFGDVPFYENFVNTVEDLERVTRLPRMSAVDTRNHLIAELMSFMENMEQVRTCDAREHRCGAAMGWMLIAKMAMWNERWETALSALAHLEEIYGNLDAYSLDDILFRHKNTPESIFEIQHAYEKGGISYASNCASACMPYPRDPGTYTYNGVDIPELGIEATTWSPIRPTTYFKSSIMPPSAGDLRRDINMVSSWNGHTFLDKNGNVNTWMGPKFWCLQMYSTSDSNNYKVFRYADAILMMAECYCELEDFNRSIAYLDKVKVRAGLSPYGVFRDKVKLREEIRKERGRELFGEFQRKFDLVRWGIWYSYTYQYNSYIQSQDYIRPCHEYYPIPDAQIKASGYMLDNKAYEAYDL